MTPEGLKSTSPRQNPGCLACFCLFPERQQSLIPKHLTQPLLCPRQPATAAAVVLSSGSSILMSSLAAAVTTPELARHISFPQGSGVQSHPAPSQVRNHTQMQTEGCLKLVRESAVSATQMFLFCFLFFSGLEWVNRGGSSVPVPAGRHLAKSGMCVIGDNRAPHSEGSLE